MLNNRGRLLTALAVGVPSVLGLYFLYRYYKSSGQVPVKKEFEIGEFDDQILNRSVSEVKERLTDQPLRSQEGVIEEIYRKSVEVIKSQFVALTQHYRTRTRAVDLERRKLSEPADQVSSIMEYEAKVKELKDSAMNCILARLDIPEDVWNLEVMTWLTPDRSEQWEALLGELEQDLNQALPVRHKNIPVQQLHNIFNHHIRFLQQLNGLKYGLNALKKQEVIGVVNHLVSDELFKKYKVENEDIQQSLGELSEQQFQDFEKELDEISSLNTGFVIGQDNEES